MEKNKEIIVLICIGSGAKIVKSAMLGLGFELTDETKIPSGTKMRFKKGGGGIDEINPTHEHPNCRCALTGVQERRGN